MSVIQKKVILGLHPGITFFLSLIEIYGGHIMKMLEELWCGNIEPTEYDTSACCEYKELLQQITRNEDALLKNMTNEQKQLFLKYTDNVRGLQTISEYSLFQHSFRLGANPILEIIEK